MTFEGIPYLKPTPGWGNIKSPFCLSIFLFSISEGQDLHLSIFPLHLPFSSPQHSSLCTDTSSSEALHSPKLLPKPQFGHDLLQNKDASAEMCSLPKSNTIHLVLKLGCWIFSKGPRVGLPKRVEVFTGSLFQRDYRTPVTFYSASWLGNMQLTSHS